ncbi:MAG: hypothetical protein LAC69_02085 [Chlorobium sp.]|jgi:hypothetical protein|nr:hypothetical protein [Chlorobium sp.]
MNEVAQHQEKPPVTSRILEWISYSLAFIAVLIGLSAVFNVQYVSKEHDKALLWFGYALIAILFPYIKVITFKDLNIVIDDIKEASRQIEGAAITARRGPPVKGFTG